MIWSLEVLIGALLVSALLLRRWPLMALAVTVGGSLSVKLMWCAVKDMLLIVAPVGNNFGDTDRDGTSFTELWEPYVSGEITEVRLPCGHSRILQPEMLGEAWTGISAWLGLDG